MNKITIRLEGDKLHCSVTVDIANDEQAHSLWSMLRDMAWPESEQCQRALRELTMPKGEV